MLRKRTPEHIRIDAIKMGVKKAQEGCPACANGYFELAQQNGATEQEIQRALEQATGAHGKGLSRRELIKIAVASGLALTTASLALPHTNKIARAATYYWGIDSNTTICCAMPLNFYIGRMGVGITADTAYYAFNTSMANQVGLYDTFGYWGVQGPTLGPDQGYSNPLDWGAAQAHAAWNAWNGTFVGADYVGGLTVFGDIEAGFGGWSDTANNQQTLNGFVQTLLEITPANVWPGLYVSTNTWQQFFGSSFVPSADFVLWLAGTYCTVCNPCGSCTTTIQDAENQFSSLQNTPLGGQNPILWQYWLTNPGCDNSGCGDWDISNQLQQSLVPAYS